MSWEGIAAGNADESLATLDAAAEHHHEELAKYIFSNLDALTEATGNQIDATGKSFFEYMYEMFDKVELTFEDDGSISPGFAFVVHPDTYEIFKQRESELTEDEKRQLDELIDQRTAGISCWTTPPTPFLVP